MAEQKPLGLLGRGLVRLLDWNSLRTHGFSAPFLHEVVASYGPVRTLGFFGRIAKVLKGLEAFANFEQIQFILGMSGLSNGCRWCGVGHIYALNIVHWHHRQKLYPLDERDVPQLQQLGFGELETHLLERFSAEEFAFERRFLRRFFQLQKLAEPVGAEEELWVQTIYAWQALNECSLLTTYDLPPEQVPPQMEVDRPEMASKAAYDRARWSARSDSES